MSRFRFLTAQLTVKSYRSYLEHLKKKKKQHMVSLETWWEMVEMFEQMEDFLEQFLLEKPSMSTGILLASLKHGAGMPINRVSSVVKMLRIF